MPAGRAGENRLTSAPEGNVLPASRHFAEEDNPGVFGSPAYAREELVGEMTAAMICGVLGIAPVKVEAITPGGEEELLLGSSAAYLQPPSGASYLKVSSPGPDIVGTRSAQYPKRFRRSMRVLRSRHDP
jgi:antirestriction protein ArdC